MSGGGFFGNILRYLIQDVAVKVLAENRGFQRFVLRIDTFFNSTTKVMESKADEIAKGAERVVNNLPKEKVRTNTGDANTKGFDPALFMKHLRLEISKDVNQLTGGGSPKP